MADMTVIDAGTFAALTNDDKGVSGNVLTGIPDNFGIKEVPIYVYNISTQEFNERRPPNHPTLLIRACPADQPYRLVGQETHPFREQVEDQNGNKSFAFRDGFREVARMLNPRNPGVDQDFDEGPLTINQNGNLNFYGVFWSRYNPPLDGELAAARKRLEKTYRAELEKMAAIEARNPDEARAMANNTSHAAAEYFDVSTTWHNTSLRAKVAPGGQVDCPNCGEKIAAQAAVCRHCQAVLDEEKARKLFPDRFRRGPGRPPNEG